MDIGKVIEIGEVKPSELPNVRPVETPAPASPEPVPVGA